jgi:hypothetical protein
MIMPNMSLFFSQENCGGTVKVKVDLKANEFTDSKSSSMSQVTTRSSTGVVDQAQLYVAPHSCASSTDGICVQGATTSGFRFYAIEVTATDAAGHTDHDTCFVVVEPPVGSNRKLEHDPDLDLSKLYDLASLLLSWDNAVAPSAEPSSMPSVSQQPSLSQNPSDSPSTQPSAQPSAQPSTKPSAQPSTKPSAQPSTQPSTQPSSRPSKSGKKKQ